jgi:hypothetical protein
VGSPKPYSQTQNRQKGRFFRALARFEGEVETLSGIITADETGFHNFEPEAKKLSVGWHHPQYPRKKKFKVSISGQDRDDCGL